MPIPHTVKSPSTYSDDIFVELNDDIFTKTPSSSDESELIPILPEDRTDSTDRTDMTDRASTNECLIDPGCVVVTLFVTGIMLYIIIYCTT